jgi:hypothetical protein
MEYIVENDRLFRITDDGKKQKLGFVTDNGRGDAIAGCISPIKENWIKECKEFGLPKYDKNQPIPFWDDGVDIKRAFDEYYGINNEQ